MRYFKKAKYKLRQDKDIVKQDQDLSAEELYQQRLKEKRRSARKR
ncbi:hypothetical protein ACFL1I_06785 [Candidatus Omnitrophota bacterium]